MLSQSSVHIKMLVTSEISLQGSEQVLNINFKTKTRHEQTSRTISSPNTRYFKIFSLWIFSRAGKSNTTHGPPPTTCRWKKIGRRHVLWVLNLALESQDWASREDHMCYSSSRTALLLQQKLNHLVSDFSEFYVTA